MCYFSRKTKGKDTVWARSSILLDNINECVLDGWPEDNTVCINQLPKSTANWGITKAWQPENKGVSYYSNRDCRLRISSRLECGFMRNVAEWLLTDGAEVDAPGACLGAPLWSRLPETACEATICFSR